MHFAAVTVSGLQVADGFGIWDPRPRLTGRKEATPSDTCSLIAFDPSFGAERSEIKNSNQLSIVSQVRYQ